MCDNVYLFSLRTWTWQQKDSGWSTRDPSRGEYNTESLLVSEPPHTASSPSLTPLLSLSSLFSSLSHPSSPPPPHFPLSLSISLTPLLLLTLSLSDFSSPTELYVLLLTDVLVLMEKHEDKYVLRCHNLEKVNGVREELSPVIRLKECLLRSAAADKGREICMPLATKASFLQTTVDREIFAVKHFSHFRVITYNWFSFLGGRTFLLVNTSSLMKLAQMYEFSAEGPQEKKQ